MTLQLPDTVPVPAGPPPCQDDRHVLRRLRDNLAHVIIGKSHEIDLFLASVLSGGHLLIEDVPGVGKTMLAKAFARSIGGTLRRIQFTPDLLPTDIVGVSVYNPKDSAFEFKPGPIFSHILMADEINRASPRTQSALLEAMGEKQVTVDGQSLPLAPCFCVIATQNPIEAQGTYPLPEAQLDRFAMQIALGYPPASEARRLLLQPDDQERLDQLQPVLAPEGLVALQKTAARISIEDSVADYLLALVEATRRHPAVRLGVSPARRPGVFGCRPRQSLAGRPRLCDPGRCENAGRSRSGSSAHTPLANRIGGPQQGRRRAGDLATSWGAEVIGRHLRDVRFTVIYFFTKRLTPAGRSFLFVWLIAALQGSVSIDIPIYHIWSFTTVCLAAAWLSSFLAVPKIQLTRRHLLPVEAGTTLAYEVELRNHTKRAAYGLSVAEVELPTGMKLEHDAVGGQS